jgi:hypothetical protein
MDAEADQATADRTAVDGPPAAPRPLRSPAPETLRLYASDWAAVAFFRSCDSPNFWLAEAEFVLGSCDSVWPRAVVQRGRGRPPTSASCRAAALGGAPPQVHGSSRLDRPRRDNPAYRAWWNFSPLRGRRRRAMRPASPVLSHDPPGRSARSCRQSSIIQGTVA